MPSKTLERILRERFSAEQRARNADEAWEQRRQDPEFLIEVLKEPILGTRPSQRSYRDTREYILKQIQERYGND